MEIINNVQGPANINRNLVTIPAPAQATFQRLGMQTGQRGIPSLEVSHLETKPLSPVDIEENAGDEIPEKEMKSKSNNVNQGEKTKFQRVTKVPSPASAEVLARRDSVRSKLGSQRMSRKTLQFQSPIDIHDDPGILYPEQSQIREAESGAW